MPEAKRNDFGLKVELPGARRGPEGRLLYTKGDRIVFRVTPARKAYIGIWTIDADGTITQLFPNQFEQDNLVPAGKTREVPAAEAKQALWPKEQRYSARAEEATAPNRADAFCVVASTRPWNPLSGEKEGPFAVFKAPEAREEALRFMRDPRRVRLHPEKPEPSEVSVKSLLHIVLPRQ
jgi:hypothetical protein